MRVCCVQESKQFPGLVSLTHTCIHVRLLYIHQCVCAWYACILSECVCANMHEHTLFACSFFHIFACIQKRQNSTSTSDYSCEPTNTLSSLHALLLPHFLCLFALLQPHFYVSVLFCNLIFLSFCSPQPQFYVFLLLCNLIFMSFCSLTTSIFMSCARQ